MTENSDKTAQQISERNKKLSQYFIKILTNEVCTFSHIWDLFLRLDSRDYYCSDFDDKTAAYRISITRKNCENFFLCNGFAVDIDFSSIPVCS